MCYAIEFQKRGLPHMHMLLYFLIKMINLTRMKKFDDVISAEIPNNNFYPRLYNNLVKKMSDSWSLWRVKHEFSLNG